MKRIFGPEASVTWEEVREAAVIEILVVWSLFRPSLAVAAIKKYLRLLHVVFVKLFVTVLSVGYGKPEFGEGIRLLVLPGKFQSTTLSWNTPVGKMSGWDKLSWFPWMQSSQMPR